MTLTATQKFFDNQTLNYDLERYPLPDIVLQVVQNQVPEVTTLETLHEVIPPELVPSVFAKASKDLLDSDFYKLYDEMVEEYIVPTTGPVLIQKFGSLRALIPEQHKHGAVLLYHQGRWVGNGLGLRTIWMPFTDCYDSNTMQIMDLDISREVTRRSVAEQWSYEKLQEVCTEEAWPITLNPGQAHLFFQEHIHGNNPNLTDKTRVSIDIRLLLKDGQPHRKWPGSYFRHMHDRAFYHRDNIIKPTDTVITYGSYEGTRMKKLDLHFQTLVVKSYCDKRGIPFPYQHGENEGLHNAHLEHLINKSGADHLLLASIFTLPEDADKRKRFMQNALNARIVLHFCNEELILTNSEDMEKIEQLINWTHDTSSPVDQLTEELGTK